MKRFERIVIHLVWIISLILLLSMPSHETMGASSNDLLPTVRAVFEDEETGEIIYIPPTDYYVSGFHNGMAKIVTDTHGYGFINKTGDVVVQVSSNWYGDFSEGLAISTGGSRYNDLYGYVDTTANDWVIKPLFEQAGSFSEGLAPVLTNGVWGYINKNGVYVIDPQFVEANTFSENLALIRDNKSMRCGYIDKTGQLVIQPKYTYADDYHEGLAAVQLNPRGKWGYINKTSRMVIPAQYSAARGFSEGLAAINTGTDKHPKWGFIDQNGKTIIKPNFLAVSNYFHHGICLVNVDNEWLLLHRSGHIIKSASWERQTYTEKVGYVNKSQQLMITPQFLEGNLFSEGLAAVRGFGYPWKWGYIDSKGKMIVKPIYDHASDFKNGRALVVLNGRTGVIDQQGRFSAKKNSTALDKDGLTVSERRMVELYLSVMKKAYTMSNGGNGFIAVQFGSLEGLSPAGRKVIVKRLKALSPNIYDYERIKNDKTKFVFQDGQLVCTRNGTVLKVEVHSYTGNTSYICGESWYGVLAAISPEIRATLVDGVWELKVLRAPVS
ncbi:MAG: WG repeat-containing protein [Ignavibacteriales bacterium]